MEAYKKKLTIWLEDKLKKYDEDEEFRTKRAKTYKDRASYRIAMVKKAEKQLLEQTGQEVSLEDSAS